MNTQLCLDKPIPLETGSPAFPLPPVLEEGISSPVAEDEWSEYPPLHGLPELRHLWAELHARWTGSPTDGDHVLVTHGAMNALFDICSTELQAGDEVLIPAPFWHHFPNILRYLPARLKVIPTSPHNGYKLTPELLEQAMSPASKLLILTNPNNPTGSIYTYQELDALADVVLRHSRLKLISDEAYNLLVLGRKPGKPCPGFGFRQDLGERLYVVSSMSKNFGLAGARVGFIVAQPEQINCLGQRQRFSALGVNLRLQQGVLRVLEQWETVLAGLMDQLEIRHRHAGQCLARHLPRVKWLQPQAGYYFYADVRSWLECITPDGRLIENDKDLADYLHREADLRVQSSQECGLTGFLRLTFAIEPDLFTEGIVRMKQHLSCLTRDQKPVLKLRN